MELILNTVTIRDMVGLFVVAYLIISQNRMNENINNIINNIIILNQKVENIIIFNQKVDTNFERVFSRLQKSHDFGVDRVAYSSSISYELDTSLSRVTAFGVFYNDRAFDVTVSHMFVNAESRSNLLSCPKLDISLSKSCPRRRNVLDGSKFTAQRAGDQVVIYGFSKMQSSYIGTLAGRWNLNEVDFAPFDDKSNIPANSLFISGANQDSGLSGSAIFNGQGIVGVVVASKLNDTSVAIAIPWQNVLDCADLLQEELQRGVSCDVQITSPPNMS